MAIWTLARKDLRVLLRDTRAAIILLTMPVIFILVLGLALGESFGQKPDDRVRISVLNEDAGLPPDAGPYPDKPWSEVVLDDLKQTGGIKLEIIPSRDQAEHLIRSGKRAAILVFTPEFSKKVHNCSFIGEEFLGYRTTNPFYRDGVDVRAVGLEILEDPKQALSSSIIKQVAQVTLLRVVMPWMIGKAFDKIGDKKFIDEMSQRVEVTMLGDRKMKPLALLNDKQRLEVGVGVQGALQEMLKKYDLRAKNWASLTRSEPVAEGSGTEEIYQPEGTGLLDRGAIRYQILVPSYTVMFQFFLVLTVGWLFTSERRQGTLMRLRASPLTRGQILFGKLIPCYAVSLGQGLFLLAAGKLIFGMNWGPYPWMMVLVVATTAMAAVGLSVLVASVAKTESQVSIYGSLLVLVLGGISGCLMPRDQMPEQMQQISLITPHAWALDAYRELLIADPNLPNVYLCCGMLTLFGVAFTGLAWLLMRLD